MCEFADLIEKSGTSGNTMKAVLDAKLESELGNAPNPISIIWP